MFNCPDSHTEWCDGEALNMKWHWLTVGCSDRDRYLKNTFYFDSVQISEQFTYILASDKAVLPR